jgi:hypothetical protein
VRTRTALALAGLAAFLGIALAPPAAHAAPAKPAAATIAAIGPYDYTLCRNVVPPGDASGEYASFCVRWVSTNPFNSTMSPYRCTITNWANHTIVVGSTGTVSHRFPNHALTQSQTSDPFNSGPDSVLPSQSIAGPCQQGGANWIGDQNPVCYCAYPDGQVVLSLPMARAGYSYASFTNTDTNP